MAVQADIRFPAFGSVRWIGLFVILVCLQGASGVLRGEGLRAGAAAVVITPPPGTPMLTPQRPPYRLLISESHHDDLFVKALVFEKDGSSAAVAVCDLTSIPLSIISEARKAIDQTCSIRGDRVMISATHTHTTPQIRLRFLRGADKKALSLAREYVAELPQKIAESVRLAESRLQPARITAGKGREDSVSFNRRFLMKDGTVETNPGKTNPARLFDIVRPTGPIDPEVPIVCIETLDSKPLALLVNFALHLDTTGGERFSADFASTLSQTLAKTSRHDLTLFSIGTAGNINHYDLLDPNRPRRTKGYEEAARIGTILAAAVLKTLPSLAPVADGAVQVRSQTVTLAMPTEKGARLAESFGNAPTFFDGEVQVTNRQGRQTFEAEVQVISIGNDLAWVSFPGEMFVELGLALKQASPFRWTIIHGIANGAIGYVPNLRAYPEGAYGAGASRCAPGSGEELVETATRLLVKMHSSQEK